MSVCIFFRNLQSLPFRAASINLKPACGCYVQRFFSMKVSTPKIVTEIDPNTGEVRKKKSPIVPKITLLSGDSITITTLAEAEKLSKRRDLRLVKIVDIDTKTQRPVYRLMTGAEYHAEDLKQKELRKKEKQNVHIKGEKVVLINSRITEHDLETHLRKAVKWLEKKYEVRVVASGITNTEIADKIYGKFEQFFKDAGSQAKLVQKRIKGSDLRFQILPEKRDGDQSKESSSDQGSSKDQGPSKKTPSSL